MNTTTGSWVAYVGLAVSALAHFGWVVDPNAIITVVGGVIALVGIIIQHYKTKQVVAGISKP